MVKKLDQLSKG